MDFQSIKLLVHKYNLLEILALKIQRSDECIDFTIK